MYPTFLYFSSDGKAVHRSVGSGTAEDIIAEGKNAFISEKAYFILLRQYQADKISATGLYTLINDAIAANDNNAGAYAKAYIRSQKDMFTKENAALLASCTHISSDTGFSIISSNEELYDKATHPVAARKIIIETLTASSYNILYEYQKTNEEPDWEAFERGLTNKYPKYSQQVSMFSKVAFYLRSKKGNPLAVSAVNYFNSYPENCEPESLNNWAWRIFLNCDDTSLLVKSLPLSMKSFEKDNKPEFMDTYAALLYRAGHKTEAIEWETKAMNLAVSDKEQYQTSIDKMKKDEKIWENQ